MAGITDKPFREICRRYGAGLVYSEMISAKGLYYNDKKTESLMDISGESPCAIQIFGSEPEIMAEIIPKVMKHNPDIIDIYRSYLEHPLSHKSEKLLHTEYVDRSSILG